MEKTVWGADRDVTEGGVGFRERGRKFAAFAHARRRFSKPKPANDAPCRLSNQSSSMAGQRVTRRASSPASSTTTHGQPAFASGNRLRRYGA